jgi:chaperonin GroEL (HSP60 family)
MGQNVVVEYEKGNPKITKDGVTVAKNCMLKDRGEEIGS